MITTAEDRTLRQALLIVVILHLLIGGWHSLAHHQVPVPLNHEQMTFIGLVIVLAPLVGAAMMWTRWMRQAALLITVSMLASFVFGFLNHFILMSPDNVLQVPNNSWRSTFVISAAAVAASEAVGTTLGAIAWCKW